MWTSPACIATTCDVVQRLVTVTMITATAGTIRAKRSAAIWSRPAVPTHAAAVVALTVDALASIAVQRTKAGPHT